MKKEEKIIYDLRKELKEQIKENQKLIAEIKELNVDNEWWNNRYKAQVRINEEHKKLNGDLRKEIDGLVTVIDLAKEYIRQCQLGVDGMDRPYMLLDQEEGKELLEILERVNEE